MPILLQISSGICPQRKAQNLTRRKQLWKQNVEKNGNLDRTLLSENGVNLGTQYVPSALIATIEQYRERVFHIKYMTMLLETYTETPVPEQEQLWNTWEAENR